MSHWHFRCPADMDVIMMMPEWGSGHTYAERVWEEGQLSYTPYIFNPSTHSFTPIRPPNTGFPYPATLPTLSSLQGNVYLIGGEDALAETVQDKTHVYDPRIGAWFHGAKLPVPICRHTTVSMEGANSLLTLGGADGGYSITDAVCSYDTRQGAWMFNPSNCVLPFSAAAVDDHTVLALAGECTGVETAAEGSCQAFTPHLLDLRMWRWQPCPAALPENYSLQRIFATAVNFQGKVVVVGGALIAENVAGRNKLSSDVLAYIAEGQGRWEMLQPLPVGLEKPSLAVVRVLEGTFCVVP